MADIIKCKWVSEEWTMNVWIELWPKFKSQCGLQDVFLPVNHVRLDVWIQVGSGWIQHEWSSRWLPSSSWVNPREDDKNFFECKMAVAESNMVEFKLAVIIKLQSRHLMSEVYFCAKWLIPRWQNSKWLTVIKLSQIEWVWVRLN